MRKTCRLISFIITAILICLSDTAFMENISDSHDVNESTSSEISISPASFSSHEQMPGEANYWTLPIDINNETAIWEVLMQPITVLKGNERQAYKLRAQPDKEADAVGEVTYASQGVRVLENLDSGWSLVEAYSSSFSGSKVKVWGKMVQGYVETKLLEEKKPYSKYGLVIDKLTQRMYVFSEGKLLTSLLISTGLPNEEQPYNETQAGEYLIVSRVGQFPAEKLLCDMGLRFNNGNYIHQVPYVIAADGSKYFEKTEPKLGFKASHGCVRVQRKKNSDGINMAWLWKNLKINTKVLVWEDYKGRQLPIPSGDTPLYYNPDGGKYYHSVAGCTDVREKYLPLTAFTYSELENPKYADLVPCAACGPSIRAAQIEEINAAHR